MKKYVLLILLAVVLLVVLSGKERKNENIVQVKRGVAGVTVSFLDIGQGDATLIDFPDGQQMLVDCAKDARILEALGRHVSFDDRVIEYLVVTHPDLDHYGGCVDVLDRFDVKHVITNGVGKSDDYWNTFLTYVSNEHASTTIVTATNTLHIASSTLRFLYPDHDLQTDPRIPNGSTADEVNNGSIILKLSYGEQDVLLMGDAGVDLEEYLLDTYANELDVEVLKVGHHGSGGSSMQEFLDLVSPEYAVISYGAENRYGHPSRRVIKKLERTGVDIIETALHGDVVLSIGEGGITTYPPTF